MAKNGGVDGQGLVAGGGQTWRETTTKHAEWGPPDLERAGRVGKERRVRCHLTGWLTGGADRQATFEFELV